MRNKLIFLVISILVLLLVVCRAFPFAEGALETESPALTATNLPTVTLQPPAFTSLPEPTATPLPPTVTPPTLEVIPVGEACLPEDATVTIDTEVLMEPDFDVDIAAYLSAGGLVDELENTFALQSSSGEEYLVRVLEYDITADSILDVLMTLTIPYVNGLGESHVLAFRCADGEYESEVLFRRAGAGARAEGLYTGGGAAIKSLDDLNTNSVPDILIEVNWPDYKEYYLFEWDGVVFNSLIYYVDILGMEKYRLEVTDGNVQVMDFDEDGLYELEVTGIDYMTGNMITVIWRWNGELFLPEE
ncbi:MAG: hypothetical protein ISS57_17525 [Anaerolineales bacterium]|nr:hypothetical protein [Anaerolineales bacterium]